MELGSWSKSRACHSVRLVGLALAIHVLSAHVIAVAVPIQILIAIILIVHAFGIDHLLTVHSESSILIAKVFEVLLMGLIGMLLGVATSILWVVIRHTLLIWVILILLVLLGWWLLESFVIRMLIIEAVGVELVRIVGWMLRIVIVRDSFTLFKSIHLHAK